ncbi:hypothetical protein C8Q76DRAFT_484712 [Earliella scabrosa]|nr:hypothetical protein C8Q76DRAFT_484712 [Earliella scabrosa]
MTSSTCQYGTTSTVTFTVPVSGHPPGHVFSFHNALATLLELQAYPLYAHKLSLGPISPAEFKAVQDALCDFLSPLQSLEELSMTLRYPPGSVAEHGAPELDLLIEMFPSLRTLRLDGISMDWESDLFTQLTHVDLRNCPATDVSQLTEFLGILPQWASLTELRMENFLSSPTFDFSDMDSLDLGDCYMRPQNLRTLFVRDFIHQIPTLLYHLDVPGPGALVHITGNSSCRSADDERSPFEAMMPFDSNLPVIFKTAASVHLTVDATTAKLVGSSIVGTMTLEVNDLNLASPHARAHTFRTALLALVNIFAARSAPVHSLMLNGDMSDLSALEWASVLQDVGPWLRELNVRNTGSGGRTKDLFNALVQPFARNGHKPVCPDLRSLMYTGPVDPSGEFLRYAHQALRERSETFQTPLTSADFVMQTDNMASYNQGIVATFKHAMKQCVYDEVRLQAMPLGGVPSIAAWNGSIRH